LRGEPAGRRIGREGARLDDTKAFVPDTEDAVRDQAEIARSGRGDEARDLAPLLDVEPHGTAAGAIHARLHGEHDGATTLGQQPAEPLEGADARAPGVVEVEPEVLARDRLADGVAAALEDQFAAAAGKRRARRGEEEENASPDRRHRRAWRCR